MTQIFDGDGRAVPVTLIEAGPCFVSQIKTLANDGYNAVQLAFDEVKPKRLSKAELGHLKTNKLPPSAHAARVPHQQIRRYQSR